MRNAMIQFLLIFILKLILCDKNCYFKSYVEPVHKTKMSGHVFLKVPVFSEFHCLDICMRYKHCRSFNVVHEEDQDKMRCELNSKGWAESMAGDVFSHPNADFYDITSDKIAQVSCDRKMDKQTARILQLLFVRQSFNFSSLIHCDFLIIFSQFLATRKCKTNITLRGSQWG